MPMDMAEGSCALRELRGVLTLVRVMAVSSLLAGGHRRLAMPRLRVRHGRCGAPVRRRRLAGK